MLWFKRFPLKKSFKQSHFGNIPDTVVFFASHVDGIIALLNVFKIIRDITAVKD